MEHAYNFWLIVQPAPDIPGQWIAHCLEVDVVTQGTSLQHAFEMAAEAVCIVVAHDLAASRDPLARRAPEEYWTELYTTLHRSKPADLRELFAHQNAVGICVAQMEIRPLGMPAEKVRNSKRTHDLPVPAAWTSSRDLGALQRSAERILRLAMARADKALHALGLTT